MEKESDGWHMGKRGKFPSGNQGKGFLGAGDEVVLHLFDAPLEEQPGRVLVSTPSELAGDLFDIDLPPRPQAHFDLSTLEFDEEKTDLDILEEPQIVHEALAFLRLRMGLLH